MNIDFKYLQLQLENEKEYLVEEIARLNVEIFQVSHASYGSSTRDYDEIGTENSEIEKDLALKKQMSVSLAEVEHALSKFDSGIYGLCDNCNQPIDLSRLEALPRVSLCMRCKRNRLETKKITV